MVVLSPHTPFVFRERPTPVPGDLRMVWRFALNLLILNKRRGNRSSIARLYILNDAARSQEDADLLGEILVGEAHLSEWRIKVEPALGRALDLMVGEGLLVWVTVSDRLGVELTPSGMAVATEIANDKDILVLEKQRIDAFAPKLTETIITEFLKVRPNDALLDF